MNRREVADLRTRFSVDGLAAVRTAFRTTGAAITALRSSTVGYNKAAGDATTAAQRQAKAATDAAKAARDQLEAVRKANTEKLNDGRASGQQFVANLKQELAAAVQAEKNARNAVRGIRAPGQFGGDEAFAAYHKRRDAALAAVAAAADDVKLKTETLAQERRAVDESIKQIQRENKTAISAAEKLVKVKQTAADKAIELAKKEADARIKNEQKANNTIAAERKKFADKAPTIAAIGGGIGVGLSAAGTVGRGGIATASALGSLSSASTRAAFGMAGIGVAAVKSGAQITTSIGTTGIGVVNRLTAVATSAASRVASIGKTTAFRAAGLGAAAVGATVGLARKATADSSEYARSTFQFGRSSGLSPTYFQVLSQAAARFDIDLGDLRGSLIQFQGQVKSAVQDPQSDMGKYFEEIGVGLVDANGNLRKADDLLLEVINKSQTLNQTARIDFLSKAFGEDDAGKLLPLFDALSGEKGPLFLAKELQRMGQLGNFVTDRDLAVAYRYKSAVDDLGNAFKGLKLQIANAIGDDVSESMTRLASVIGRNRVTIAQFFRAAFNEFIKITNDVQRIWYYGTDFTAKNGESSFVRVMLKGYNLLRDAAKFTVRFMREAYATIRGDDEKVKEFPWMITIRDGIATAIATVKQFAVELKAAIFGTEYNLGTTQFPWIFTIKAAILDVISYVKLQWTDLVAVFNGGQAQTGLGGFFARAIEIFTVGKTAVSDFVGFVKLTWADLQKVFAGDDQGTFNFEFFRGMATLLGDLQTAWGIFTDVVKGGYAVIDGALSALRDGFEYALGWVPDLLENITGRALGFTAGLFLLTGVGRIAFAAFRVGITVIRELGALLGIGGAIAGAAGAAGGLAKAGAAAGAVGGVAALASATARAGDAAAGAVGKWGRFGAAVSKVAGVFQRFPFLSKLLGLGSVASVAIDAAQTDDPDFFGSVGGGIAAGAFLGSQVSPGWGTLIGSIGGGLYGYKNYKADETAQRIAAERRRLGLGETTESAFDRDNGLAAGSTAQAFDELAVHSTSLSDELANITREVQGMGVHGLSDATSGAGIAAMLASVQQQIRDNTVPNPAAFVGSYVGRVPVDPRTIWSADSYRQAQASAPWAPGMYPGMSADLPPSAVLTFNFPEGSFTMRGNPTIDQIRAAREIERRRQQ